VVLDTSAVVDHLYGTGAAERVAALLSGSVPAAPDLLVFEVLAVVRRDAARGLLDARRARAVVDDLGDLRIELFPSLPLRRRVWDLRENLTVADALFVALAELLAEPLVTKDSALAAAAGAHADVEIQLV
jgi:predicted nucleic acid-binding protein